MAVRFEAGELQGKLKSARKKAVVNNLVIQFTNWNIKDI
ncbi:hypothetical protein LEP1GSC074_2800 [Leptospira noguchii str. Hook]|uniref:Uncharacterized protein n=1 Tax=Leptospira noguchii serovar Autumnalis str. ZUN142 TaxID=1085540 RepID=M6UAD8_9LEPT|nr:hypothetical protein LEP1GSC186_2066 [Leptospira noguchii serovar Autumnalis str. ZUN142]EMS89355.1 hypothetical protein LEP1GSC074_2800 [Leptospira noguchii str. Hook]